MSNEVRHYCRWAETTGEIPQQILYLNQLTPYLFASLMIGYHNIFVKFKIYLLRTPTLIITLITGAKCCLNQ